jgi:hypothetical protein
VAHELNVEQFWRGCFGARRGARSEYGGSYINDEQQSMSTKETAKKVKHLVREPLGSPTVWIIDHLKHSNTLLICDPMQWPGRSEGLYCQLCY